MLTIDSRAYILLGDLNFHLVDRNNPSSTALLGSFSNIRLTQLVPEPTLTAGHTLDSIFTTSIKYNYTTPLTLTNHGIIHFQINTPQVNTLTRFSIPSCSWGRITQSDWLSALSTDQPSPIGNLDKDTNNFNNWIKNCVDSLTPIKPNKHSSSNKQAFNTVSHNTLLRRLHKIGIQGSTLKWICFFVHRKIQRIRLPPFTSEAKKLICGVPQGSSLSHTLFKIYMKSLVNIIRSQDITVIS